MMASISAGLIHSPPDLIRSLARPVMIRLTVRVDARQVAGVEPAVRVGGPAFIAEVALDHAGAAHAQMPFDIALLGQRPTICIRQQKIHADRRAARDCRGSLGSARRRHRTRRRQLGHAPAGLHRNAAGAARCAPSAQAASAMPPTTIRLSDGSSPPVASRCSTSPSQTVGTPTATVTPSARDQPRQARAVRHVAQAAPASLPPRAPRTAGPRHSRETSAPPRARCRRGDSP